MRGIRSLGLLALYVGAQVVALLLAVPFRSAGLSSTSNPNSPVDPLLIIGLIVLVPLVIIWLARRRNGIASLRYLILIGIAGSMTITLTATYALFLPTFAYLPPFGVGEAYDFFEPLAAITAVGFFLALVMEPQWYVVDAAGFVAGGSLIALLGISFGILPALILLSALAVYDAIAVYVTKHMISLADVVTEMKLPILMVMPTRAGYDYTRSGTFQEQRGAPIEDREVMFMGLGDIVIPGTLVVSAFIWLPTTLFGGVGVDLWVALGTMAGSLVGYAFLMRLVTRGTAQAGLPLLNGGAIAGYVLTYVLLFHSLTLGISTNFSLGF
jgi:presenilin-like A22 family membrane protease